MSSKLIIRNLQKQSDTINEQSTLRRRALEDEERQQEMQWFNQRHQIEKKWQIQSQPNIQGHQQDDNEDQISQLPPVPPHDTLQCASTTVLSPIQEEFDSSGAHSDVRISSHADDLPGAHLPPSQPRQGEQVTS